QEPDQGRGLPAPGGDVPGPPADARVARRGRSGVRGQGSHHGAARRGQDSVPRAGRPQTQEDHRGTYPGRPAMIHRLAIPINIVVPRAATEREVRARVSVPAKVASKWTITLSARKLAEIVKELPAAGLTLKVGESAAVNLRCAGVNYRLVGLASDDFPAVVPAAPPAWLT